MKKKYRTDPQASSLTPQQTLEECVRQMELWFGSQELSSQWLRPPGGAQPAAGRSPTCLSTLVISPA